MFVCGKCGRQTSPREKALRLIQATKSRSYTNERGKVVGYGFEIVKELTCCRECKDKAEGGGAGS